MNIENKPTSRLIEKGSLTSLTVDSRDGAFTNICTGFGMDREVPVRLGAYALPALQMAEQYCLAQTEFYIAGKFAQKLNGLDKNVIDRNSQLIEEYISLLRSNLGLTTQPKWLIETDPFALYRSKVLNELVTILKSKASERIARFAESRDGDESYTYMAAHALYMWDELEVDQRNFLTYRDTTPRSLVMIGGPAEKVFYEARQILKSNYTLNPNRLTVQGFSDIGRRPPYYALQGERVIGSERTSSSFADLLSVTDPDALRDTLYLLVSLSESLTFDDIPRIKKAALSAGEIDDLQQSCRRLSEIINQLES